MRTSTIAMLAALLIAGCAAPGPRSPPAGGPPEDAEGWYRQGNALAREDRLEEARAAYLQALALQPDLARARHNLGLVHLQLGWKALLQARRDLPAEDRAAAATMDYLGCLMQVFTGRPDSIHCGPPPGEETQQ